MPRIELPYGRERVAIEVPEANLIGCLEGRPMDVRPLEETFAEAWENPIGMDDPAESFQRGDSVVLVVTDHTRPTPTRELLPLIWGRVEGAISPEDVTILVATGTHRPTSDEELDDLLGDARDTFRVAIHDCDRDVVDVGETSRGNRILFHRLVAEADHVVTIGSIGMHYYAGYSGGRKNLLPGIAGRETIERNHALLCCPESCACSYEGNPINEEMVEAGRTVRYRFSVDVVLDASGRVGKIVVGEPEAAHAVGRAFWDEHFQVPLETQADLVIASSGGHPKDINLYQAHKAQYNASLATREGGLLVLVAACPKGIGHPVFEDWIRRSETPEDALRIYEEEGFVLGGHKAVYLAKDRMRIDLALMSDLDSDLVRRFFMLPVTDPAEVLELARERFGPDYRVLVMPHAGATFPVTDGS